MKNIHLIHNPGAGEESHSKSTLLRLLEGVGYECRYCSTKENDDWKDIDPSTDLIVIAGGDGTVKKVAGELLEKDHAFRKIPIAILPCGTANNIAGSLNIKGEPVDIIRSWGQCQTMAIDVGEIDNIGDNPDFFIESFGYGLFPYLMKEMDKNGRNELEEREEKMRTALAVMHTITQEYEPHYCELIIDGENHSGEFIMAEVMNTRFIGPNLFLSPYGHPGDGTFEVILIPGDHKEKFTNYLEDKLQGKDTVYSFVTLKAEDVIMKWKGKHVHVDDKVIKLEKNTDVHVKVQKNALTFLL